MWKSGTWLGMGGGAGTVHVGPALATSIEMATTADTGAALTAAVDMEVTAVVVQTVLTAKTTSSTAEA